MLNLPQYTGLFAQDGYDIGGGYDIGSILEPEINRLVHSQPVCLHSASPLASQPLM
jgi:hypothetical protein